MSVREEPLGSLWHHQGSSWSREQLLAGKQKKINFHTNQIHFCLFRFSSFRFLQQQIPFNKQFNSIQFKRTQM
ncbi:unnamed protein product [Rotaria socialis]